jgi:hypothetical protein
MKQTKSARKRRKRRKERLRRRLWKLIWDLRREGFRQAIERRQLGLPEATGSSPRVEFLES